MVVPTTVIVSRFQWRQAEKIPVHHCSPQSQPRRFRGKFSFSMPSSGILLLICVVQLLRHDPALFLTYAFSRGHPYMGLSNSWISFTKQNLSGREGQTLFRHLNDLGKRQYPISGVSPGPQIRPKRTNHFVFVAAPTGWEPWIWKQSREHLKPLSIAFAKKYIQIVQLLRPFISCSSQAGFR